MVCVEYVDPVKLIVAILWKDSRSLELAMKKMEKQCGTIDFNGTDHLFQVTRYYENEMGPYLKRRLVSFARLIPPETIREVKLKCNGFEKILSKQGQRKVNLDAGYLDHSKLVLASMKFAGQKIHLGDGVYADLVSRYRTGRYRNLEWTFPDFRDGRYDQELCQIRVIYMKQRRGH